MTPDTELEHELARLGQSMTPDDSFVTRVMEQLDADPNMRSKPSLHTPKPTKLVPWVTVGMVLAASLLIALGWFAALHTPALPPTRVAQHLNTNTSVPLPSPTTQDAVPDPHVWTATQWQTVTEREVTLTGNIPARLVRRQAFERVRWVDPQRHTTFEKVVPRERATFISMESY